MSIQSTNRVAGPYLCNGSTTQFPFSFKVFSTSEVVVVLTDDNGVEAPLALTTDFTVALNANQDASPGGTITTLTTYATGNKVTLTSEVAETQPETLTNQGGFYPKVIEYALDRLTIMVQQLSDKISRTVQAPISGGTSAEQLLEQLSEQLPLVAAVYTHLAYIQAVSANQANVDAVATSIAPINAIAADMSGSWAAGVTYDFGSIAVPPSGGTTDPTGNIVTVAGHIDNVDAVADNMADVQTVSLHISAVDTVAAGIASVNSVVADQDNIDLVAGDLAHIDTVASNIAQVDAVAGSVAQVDAVAADLANVDTVAGIAVAVSTVAASNAAVTTVGKDLTGAPVVIDYGSVAVAASNPVAPGGVLGAVYSNAANIATLAANVAALVQAATNLPAILSALSGALTPANNLSDLSNKATARANLGLADLGSVP